MDTNIFISSILGGNLGVIIDEWMAGKFKLIVSEAIAREYLDVINRPKFKILPIEIVTVTEYLLQHAEFVTPEERIVVIVTDPADNKFLEAAIAGKVNYIVSGDRHLLELGSFRGIPIIKAADFIALLIS
ncbi:MAG: putative toxin-antitoxin system toxin component, PIN family [Anaerolineae bacterium]